MNDLKYKTIEELELERAECNHLLDKYTKLYAEQEIKYNLINEVIGYKKKYDLKAIEEFSNYIEGLIKKCNKDCTLCEAIDHTYLISHFEVILRLAKKGIAK